MDSYFTGSQSDKDTWQHRKTPQPLEPARHPGASGSPGPRGLKRSLQFELDGMASEEEPLGQIPESEKTYAGIDGALTQVPLETEVPENFPEVTEAADEIPTSEPTPEAVPVGQKK